MLVVATWNEKNYEGVMTGKIYEYLLANKPIIGIISGKLSSSALAGLIKSCNIGIAYEYVNDKQDYIMLKWYLTKCFMEILKAGSISFKPNLEAIQKFDYRNIVKEIIQIYNEHQER